jgi:hypothetical protein
MQVGLMEGGMVILAWARDWVGMEELGIMGMVGVWISLMGFSLGALVGSDHSLHGKGI